jgi:hypothetical protein
MMKKPARRVSTCILCLNLSRETSRRVNTDRRGSVAARDRSSVKRNVRVQSSALVAALLVWVAGAGLVAVFYIDSLRRLVVRAPAFLPLEDGVGEFALAVVVAETEGLVDVLA